LAVGVNTAAVFHTSDGLQSHLHNIVPSPASGAGNKANATGVVLKFRAIERLLVWLNHRIKFLPFKYSLQKSFRRD
jgi:hypothetical protein